MKYQSTRNRALTASPAQAVLAGIAPDGGLYMPESIPVLDWQSLLNADTLTLSARILSALLPDYPDMDSLVRRGYAGKFETEELTPLVKVGSRYVLELFRGPTSAFKDVALSLLPQLISQARDMEGIRDEMLILTATSGDTGKAALEGFHDVPGTKIIVFYPHGGVSAVQQAQMVTQEGSNVKVCAVRGNFDDTQTGVKKVFAACADKSLSGVRLSSANSINIGRLAPQIVYYFKAYADLVRSGRIHVGDKVHFCVPTGNFGDILAGYFAKRMGLPVGRLICASNRNDVLTDFLSTGVYDKRRTFYKTTSPSMDILVSSNLERLLSLFTGDDAYVAGLMKALNEEGHYKVTDELLLKLQAEFSCGCCDDEAAARTIGKVWAEEKYLCVPHTAVAWTVADQFAHTHDDGAPVVVLSTASPYKFPAAVLSALGQKVSRDEFSVMEDLHTYTGIAVPKNLAALRQKSVRHKDVIDREDMLSYVLQKAGEKQW